MKLPQIIFMMLMTTTMSFSQIPKKTETISFNGANIYYEVFGKGSPLFLLHGYTQTSKSWLPFIDDFANEYEVYLVDLKGHGKSSPFTEKLSIKSAAIDLNALIRYLKLDNINAIGYSYGGDILFQLALLNPSLIKSMITIGSCGSWNANDFPAWLDFLSYKNIDNLPWMREQQTGEKQIQNILEQLPNYNIRASSEELKTIQAQVLIVVGDNDDSLPFEDVLNAKKELPNSSLWIVPNTGHGAHRDNNKTNFVRISKEFFNPNSTLETINSKNFTMDKDKIKSEIIQAETNLFILLRQGELMKAVSMHINSPDYRQIWNGEEMTYGELETRVKKGIQNGLKSFEYKVQNRDFKFINADNVLETFSAFETTIMADGSSTTSRLTAVTILWQRIDSIWRLGYVHGSELPKEN